jgi:glycosyltransferase involved in cell wall biosynthesis
MTSGTTPGPGAGRLYEVVSGTWWAELDERERRLLDGALAVSVLTRPGATLRVLAVRGEPGSVPVLTGQTVTELTWEGAGSPVALLEVTAADQPAEADVTDLVLYLGGQAPAFVQATPVNPSRLASLYFSARGRAPVAFDVLRQWRTDRVERRPERRTIPRMGAAPRSGEPPATGSRPRAILFGLHWLELGGAERWALECIAAATAAGCIPIVLTDRASSSPWVTRAEMAGAIFLPLTAPLVEGQEAALLNGLFDRFDVRGIHLHHCSWLYQRLPWIRARFPHVPIVDSLHILEWRTGGFVDIAVRLSDAIDVHHVISPQLRDYLVQDMRIPRDKVALATLADLTATAAPAQPAPASGEQPTIAFVGRLTQQKRPYLFLRLVDRLRRDLPDARFVLHGDGELADEVHALSRRLGLAGAVEFRGADRPVAETLAEADVLVITSDNEGVTLTSFEADSHGTLVVSTDVGSQRSVVVDELLVPRHPVPFLRAARRLVVAAATDPARRERWLAEQRRKVTAFAGLPHARAWTQDLYREWTA